MEHYTIIHSELNDLALVGIVFLFVLYNFILLQLSPYIKKLVGRLFDIIVKRDKKIGF